MSSENWITVLSILSLLSPTLEPDIGRITIKFIQTLVNAYGEKQDVQVMFIQYNRTTWERIDWENSLIGNIPITAGVFAEHDAIR